jgi:phosphopentomutase
VVRKLGDQDLLILTADHGCDPTVAGTDHTREFIPILAYSPALNQTKFIADIGTRGSFTDIAASISKWFEMENQAKTNGFNGKSFLNL